MAEWRLLQPYVLARWLDRADATVKGFWVVKLKTNGRLHALLKKKIQQLPLHFRERTEMIILCCRLNYAFAVAVA